MGSGKTTVGRILAERLGYRFVDTDAEIESRAGETVGEIFRRHGEASFRERELEVVRDLMNSEACVIATGGGAFVQEACASDLLGRSLTVNLACDLDEGWRRATLSGTRPLLAQGESGAASLYAERKDKYSQAHLTVDTTRIAPGEAADRILNLLPGSRP